MAAAKERFTGTENIEYSVMDISKDPAAQGFQLASYDLVIASNVGLLYDMMLCCCCGLRYEANNNPPV